MRGWEIQLFFVRGLGFSVWLLSLAGACSQDIGGTHRVSNRSQDPNVEDQTPRSVDRDIASSIKLYETNPAYLLTKEVFKKLPSGVDTIRLLCDTSGGEPLGQDKINKVFCDPGKTPEIKGFKDLLRVLGLEVAIDGGDGGAAFTLSGHSSSLVSRFSSAINPRAFIFSRPTGTPIQDYVGVTFVRGEQTVEIVANDPSAEPGSQLNFYLLTFTQACNRQASGCTNSDLYTSSVESNWDSYSIFEDDGLDNTLVDCKVCHQPGGPQSPKILRMQEILPPYTHFMSQDTVGGRALFADFWAAHGPNEPYAQIPAAALNRSDPGLLARLLNDHGFGQQPNAFDSEVIERQVAASQPKQPADNRQPGQSAAWELLYKNFTDGLVIAPPYHDVKVTDPELLPLISDSYKKYGEGKVSSANFPDMAKVVLKDALPHMGLAPKPGSTGAEIITQACAICHHSRLDQTLSRARFDVDLSRMSRQEKDKAIARLKLPLTDPLHMPPAFLMQLTPEEVDRAVATLNQ